jgi:pyruvate kinase
MANTKIVATLGPSSESPEIVRSLLNVGVDVFRINASHGTQEGIEQKIRTIRAVSQELGVHTGVLLDLQGPKIRLGTFEEGRCTLLTGSRFTITTEPLVGNADRASTTYLEFARDVRPGDRILLNDGAAELRALTTDGVSVTCEVISGGEIGDRKGINLPGVKVSSPSLTKKDISDLEFGLSLGIDFVAMSFVRTAADVQQLRFFLESKGARVPIVAKIEKPEGVENLDSILLETEGVMVARGDLGIEMAIQKVPRIQKEMIRKARMQGKFVITATQMLESMIQNWHPTRAEVSDVANAIYDGTDAVMLSGETAAGRYPVESARMMDQIACETESGLRRRSFQGGLPEEDLKLSSPEIIADAAYRAARMSGAKAIAVFTSTGASARNLARFRPPVTILAFTPSEEAARQLSVIFGVLPLLIDRGGSTDGMITRMDQLVLENQLLSVGDRIVITAGQPIGVSGSTNLLKIHTITGQ